MDRELPYWFALAHTPKVWTKKKNRIVVDLFNQKKSIIDFFESDPNTWENTYGLKPDDVENFKKEKSHLPNHTFAVEELLKQGYQIIPITSESYSPILKKNLKTAAPPIIYTKGNLKILTEESIAIVGSRKASEISLEFTDRVAQQASEKYKVVVSGGAKGVDKKALDSAIKYKGQSVIVLPQGIMTYGSGFRKYYRQIAEGDVLVLSIFPPKLTWSVGNAMARNKIIYGLASEIYVAESSDKGGTWSGAIDGLNKNRKIYIRKPSEEEENANEKLIEKGGVPVDKDGNEIKYFQSGEQVEELSQGENQSDFITQVISLLKESGETFTSKQIIEKLKLDTSITPNQFTPRLKKLSEVKTIESKPLKFQHATSNKGDQGTLPLT